MTRAFLTWSLLVLFGSVALAQSSPSYRLEEATINAGGNPRGGIGLGSTSFRMSLDVVGELPTGVALQSADFSIDVGFARCYPPPREVQAVVALGDKATFAWAPERSVGSYRVYRGSLDEFAVAEGACLVKDVDVGQATLPANPEAGGTFFYLVTAQNTLLEEGMVGVDSAGTPRVVAGPCP